MPQTSSQGPLAVPCLEQHSSQTKDETPHLYIHHFWWKLHPKGHSASAGKIFLTQLNIFSIWPSVMECLNFQLDFHTLLKNTLLYTVGSTPMAIKSWKLLRQLKKYWTADNPREETGKPGSKKMGSRKGKKADCIICSMKSVTETNTLKS